MQPFLKQRAVRAFAFALLFWPIISHAADADFDSFYTKRLDDDGIVIRAHHDVADEALTEAKQRLEMMLTNLPSVRSNLVNAGAEIHIIGRNQATSDLPENRALKGKPFDGQETVDERTRGLGGLWSSCGEENLLRLPDDRYRGRDILVHEFAHGILDNGTSPEFRERVSKQYDASIAAGKWAHAYAATNYNDFFAELSMWYFGTHGDLGMPGPKPADGREGLRAYDPDAFALLDDFYQGRIYIPVKDYIQLASLPVEQAASVRSRSAGARSSVTFHNETAQKLQIFWINYDGERQPYGELDSHASAVRSTYATHPWLCVDESGRVVALFVARAGDCLARIEPIR